MRLRCCWNARGWKMAVLIISRVWKQIGHLTARLIFLLWLFRLLFCACSNPRVNQVPSLLHPLVFQHNLQVLLAVTLKHRVPDALSARRLHKNAVHAAPSGDSIRSNSRLQTQQIGAVQHGDHAVALQEEGSQGLEVWSSKKIKKKDFACSIFRRFAGSANRQCLRCTSLWILRCSRSRSEGLWQCG